jgi:hypothetical protein
MLGIADDLENQDAEVLNDKIFISSFTKICVYNINFRNLISEGTWTDTGRTVTGFQKRNFNSLET